MKRVSRRDFVKGLAGLGFCTLAGSALFPRRRGPEPVGGAKGWASPNLPLNAREVLYYTGVEENLNCASYYGTAEPSRALYCHISSHV